MFHAISTRRSNDLVNVLVVQNENQLRTLYTKEEAEALISMAEDFICGQVIGDSAKRVAELMQDGQSMSINLSDTSKQLDAAITPATIANLSSEKLVGVVADDPNQPIDLKAILAK